VRAERGKATRNTKLLEKRLVLDPDDFTVHGYLAHEYIAAGDTDRALTIIEQGWALVREARPDSLRSCLRLAAVRALLQFKRGDAEGALDTAMVGLAYEGFQPDLSFFAGHAQEQLAQRATSASERADRLASAEKAYVACLTTRGKVLAQRYVKGVSSWLSMTRLGTVQLLSGQTEAALRSFEDALNDEPSLDEAALGRAETLVELGRSEHALVNLNPLLDPAARPSADAWLIAALAADAMGDLDDFSQYLARARNLAKSGYAAAHRNRRHGSLHCQLLCYHGTPSAGHGTIGTAASLMAASSPPAPWAIEPGERRQLSSFVRNLLLGGKSELVERLLRPGSDDSLPGITTLVHDVVRGLGMTIEDQ
jgi:tetratricopeptide (TPR) repeat protein